MKYRRNKPQFPKESTYELKIPPQPLPGHVFQLRTPLKREQELSRHPDAAGLSLGIDRALKAMARLQKPDGSWEGENTIGMTSLALLAFLGHGENEYSLHGSTVKKAIEFLAAQQTEQGNFGELERQSGPYQHALATMALGEARLVAGRDDLLAGLDRAVAFILTGQQSGGTWSYGYQTHGLGDTFNTGMQLLALLTAERAGVRREGIRSAAQRALQEVIARQVSGGGFTYQLRRGVEPGVTGMAALCLHLNGLDALPPSIEASRGLSHAIKNWKNTTWPLFSTWFLTMAARQQGGAVWDQYRDQVLPEVLRNQDKDGLWPPPGPETRYGSIYATAVATLILQTPYRLDKAWRRAPPFVWEISRAGTTSHIFGAIPARPEEVARLDGKTPEWVEACDLLLVETHPVRFRAMLAREARYPAGDSLERHIPDEWVRALKEQIYPAGDPVREPKRIEQLLQMRPWAHGFVHLTRGLEGGLRHRSGRVLTDHLLDMRGLKPWRELVKAPEQAEFLAQLTDAQQTAFLKWAFLNSKKIETAMNRVHDAWTLSDRAEIERIVEELLAQDPDIAALRSGWMARQNRLVAERVEQALSRGQTCFVALNALRLIGQDGVLNYLREKGYSVRPVNNG
ncbi:MAG: TraB/GumN family protein, partial [Verrucomicrobiota bacterium]